LTQENPELFYFLGISLKFNSIFSFMHSVL